MFRGFNFFSEKLCPNVLNNSVYNDWDWKESPILNLTFVLPNYLSILSLSSKMANLVVTLRFGRLFNLSLLSLKSFHVVLN